MSPAGEAGSDTYKLRVFADIFPSRVRLTFTGRTRSLPKPKNSVLDLWARLYAGAPEHYTRAYETEFLFTENGRKHWLAVRKQLVGQFKKDVKKDDAVDLFLIRLGGVRIANKWELLLLVETFQKVNDQP